MNLVPREVSPQWISSPGKLVPSEVSPGGLSPQWSKFTVKVVPNEVSPQLASRARFRIAFCYTTSGGKYHSFFFPAHEKDRHPPTAKQSSVVTYCRPAVTLCSFCTYQTDSRRFVKIQIQRNLNRVSATLASNITSDSGMQQKLGLNLSLFDEGNRSRGENNTAILDWISARLVVTLFMGGFWLAVWPSKICSIKKSLSGLSS